MNKEILSQNQVQLLPLIKQFKREFYLAGGMAIALHIRRRRSIDFDLYFILNNHYTLKQISDRANFLFDQLFSEKLFRAQLSYFEDIDNTEQVEFVVTAVPEAEIKEFLIDKATDLF
jgi:hypothetical protein